MTRVRETADTDAGTVGETVELLRAGETRYLAHDPGHAEAWITSALVVANRP